MNDLAHRAHDVNFDGDWIDGPWSALPDTLLVDGDTRREVFALSQRDVEAVVASSPLGTGALRAEDPEAIAAGAAAVGAYRGRPRPLSAAVALGFAPGSWLPALVTAHRDARPGNRRWLALAGTVHLARAAERGEAIDPDALALWNDAVRRDPARHPGLRHLATGYRRILHAALSKIAAAAPEVAEAALQRGLSAEPSFRAEPLATFRHLAAAPSPKAREAARAMLTRAEDAKIEDDEGHVEAGVAALADKADFVRAYLEAGGGKWYRDSLVAPLSPAERRALSGGDEAALRAIVRSNAERSRPTYDRIQLDALKPYLRELYDESDTATKLLIARSPLFASDVEVTRLLLEEGDGAAFEVGAGRLLASGAAIDPAHGARAAEVLRNDFPAPATLELMARAAPQALAAKLGDVLKAMKWNDAQKRQALYGVVGALAVMEDRDKKIDTRLKKMASDDPIAVLPILLADRAKDRGAMLAQLATPREWRETPFGALIAVPDVGDALVAHLERVDPKTKPPLVNGVLAAEHLGVGEEARGRLIDGLIDLVREADWQLRDWAGQTLARLGPRPELADRLVDAIALHPSQPRKALVSYLVSLGDERVFDVVAAADPSWRPSLLTIVSPLDPERAFAMTEALGVPDKDALFYLAPVAAAAKALPRWYPKKHLAEGGGRYVRLRLADVDDAERQKLFEEHIDASGWWQEAMALTAARDTLRRFPAQMRAVLEAQSDSDDPFRAYVARSALALGPSDDTFTGPEPTSGFADEISRTWPRWLRTEQPGYAPPFHPSWTKRALG